MLGSSRAVAAHAASDMAAALATAGTARLLHTRGIMIDRHMHGNSHSSLARAPANVNFFLVFKFTCKFLNSETNLKHN
jgi:hypothetical protein